ncbi:MAG TPA: glycosyltransferase [Dongiaceae bacterium]
MKILLLSHAFPPLSVIASHRAYGWARAWAAAGHDVHVLTQAKSAMDGPLDLDLPIDGLQLHTVPAWWSRSPAPVGGAPRASALARWALLKQKTRRLRDRLGPLGDIRLLLVPSLVRAGQRIAAAGGFDVIVSSYGPASNVIAGSILARKTGIPWVVDYQDLWSENYLWRRGALWRRVSLAMERRIVRRAALLVTLSQGLAARIDRSLGRRAMVAYFGYLENDDDPPATVDAVDSAPGLVYAGRIYEAHQTAARFFGCLANVLARRPDIREALRLDFYGPDQEPLRRMVRAAGAAPLARLAGLIAHREVLAAERRAAALLFFDWIDPSAPGVMTGKLFEYLRSGRPIVFIGAGFETEASALARRSGAALVLQTEREIEQFLERWPLDLATCRPDAGFIAELSCRRQAAIVLAEIERKLAKSP